MRLKVQQFAAIAATSVLMLSGAQAAVYDAVNDFSTSSNTSTDTWSYRTSTSLAHDGNYTLLPSFQAFGGFTGAAADTAGWTAGSVPAIGINRSGADQYFTGFGPGAQFTWPAGSLFMHPGSASLAIVSWLSPGAYSLDIVFQFNDLDANPSFGDGIDWSIEKNNGAGASVASGTVSNGGDTGPLSVSHLVVAAGDRINFIVGPHGDFQGDSSRLRATITATPLATVSPVPEPSSAILWFVGAAGLLAAAARKRCAR